LNGGLASRAAVVCGLTAATGAVAGLLVEAYGPHVGIRVLIVAVAVVVGLSVGYLGFREAARAVAGVSAASNRVAEGYLGQRVDTSSRMTGGLTYNFNSMAARVKDLFDSIAAEHARLEAVFDASTDAMIAVARDTTICFLNPAAARMLGAGQESAIGRPLIEIARDYELDAVVRAVIAGAGGGQTRVITFGGQRIPLRASAVPIREGGDWAVLLMLTDLTEVQRFDQIRRDFVSNVSHELRTPLAAIRAMAESLESGAVEGPEDTQAFLVRIRQQVDRLTALVNELLDLSRIESGAIELRPEPIDLADVVEEAASLLRARARAEEVAIVGPAARGLVVEGDRASLLRVVSNLLDNAIKYSPRGGTVHAETRDEGELVALSVRDEGAGIEEQDLPRVFERFYKGDASRATSGVGLGLAIVKHLVRAHGGTVSAVSPPGSGATFTVRLPKTFVGTRRQ
jgi:two-component system phosphate regulon sensor histidine kinase PhoR